VGKFDLVLVHGISTAVNGIDMDRGSSQSRNFAARLDLDILP
jgi:hypothetical protein